jgi:hypothetical protein
LIKGKRQIKINGKWITKGGDSEPSIVTPNGFAKVKGVTIGLVLCPKWLC